MIKVLSAPEYGQLVLFDQQSGETSFQCLCGQMATWWKRVPLNEHELAEYRAGKLDLKRLMVEVCRELPSVSDRLIEPVELTELTF